MPPRYLLLGGTPDQRQTLVEAAPDLFGTTSARQFALIVSLPDALHGDWHRLASAADLSRIASLPPRSRRGFHLILADADRLPGATAAFGALSAGASDDVLGALAPPVHCAIDAALARILAWITTLVAAAPPGPARASAIAFAAACLQCRKPLCDLAREIGPSELRGAFLVTFGGGQSSFARLLDARRDATESHFVGSTIRALREAPPTRPSRWTSPAMAWAAGAALPLAVGLALAVPPFTALFRNSATKHPVARSSVTPAAQLRASVEAQPTPAPFIPPYPGPLPAFAADAATAYRSAVLPECEKAVRGNYPFIGNGATEISPDAFRRVFGRGGIFDSFLRSRLQQHLDRSGPVWRWRWNDPASAGFRPETPMHLAETLALGRLADEGMAFRARLVAATGGVDSAELLVGGRRTQLTADTSDARFEWRLEGGAGDATLTLFVRGQLAGRFVSHGAWSAMRLIESGDFSDAGLGGANVTFGDGVRSATLAISVDRGGAAFGRNGLWTFRCPPEL